MKIFVDENIPSMTVSELQGRGHEVRDIRGTELEGISDEEIWKIVQKEKDYLSRQIKDFPLTEMTNTRELLLYA